jgi:hypothetical protein
MRFLRALGVLGGNPRLSLAGAPALSVGCQLCIHCLNRLGFVVLSGEAGARFRRVHQRCHQLRSIMDNQNHTRLRSGVALAVAM